MLIWKSKDIFIYYILMKKLINIGTFPNTIVKKNILSECIDKLSNSGYDLMITSHFPIPDYIQDKVNYVIYDRENTLEPYHLTPIYHYNTNEFNIEVNNNGHLTTVCRNINNGLGLAKHLGYDFFYHIESDNLFSKNDITKLDELCDNMFKYGKEMIFFGYNHQGTQIYESLIFGGKPSYFLYKMPLPLYIEDFENIGIENTLETTFYKHLKSNEHEFLIINQPSQLFFKDSEINKLTNFSQVEILYDIKYNRYLLWISNLFENPNSIYISIDNSDEFEVIPNAWVIRDIVSDNPIRVKINENEMIIDKVFTFTDDDKIKYINKSKITYK